MGTEAGDHTPWEGQPLLNAWIWCPVGIKTNSPEIWVFICNHLSFKCWLTLLKNTLWSKSNIAISQTKRLYLQWH